MMVELHGDMEYINDVSLLSHC